MTTSNPIPPQPTDAASEPVLRLDPDSLILGDGDRLQLINRRGSFEMQGKSLHQLHQLFAPHLNGSHRESELVSAVAANQASAVGSYLGTLRSFGAFVEPAASVEESMGEGLPLDALSPSQTVGTFAVAGLAVHISLHGNPDDAEPYGAEIFSDHSLRFVTPAHGLQRLTAWDRVVDGTGWHVLVLVPGAAPAEAELRRRVAVARWLLSGATGPRDGVDRLQIFRLGAAATVEPLASIDLQADLGEAGRIDERGDGRVGLATLPDQLGWIASEDVEQLPLVVARSRLPFVDRANTGWIYGLHHEAVRQALLDESFGALALETALPESVEPAASWIHDRRRSHLLLKLAERHESRLAPGSWQPVDLAALAGDAAVTCVQGMLRTHFETLPAYRGTTPGGAVVVKWRGPYGQELRLASFFPLKAHLEMLLRILFTAEYGALQSPAGAAPAGAAPAVSYDDYLTPSEAARIAARYSQLPVGLREATLLGRSVWSGRLLRDET